MGLRGLEPLTSPLSGVRSNLLSYRPLYELRESLAPSLHLLLIDSSELNKQPRRPHGVVNLITTPSHSRKEVIQPQVLLRLPCYDFTPVADSTVEGSQFSFPASGEINSHGVTGGEYKTRERIHRGMADPRLLAIPASCSRVADCNPN